jgi:hypothetical protein
VYIGSIRSAPSVPSTRFCRGGISAASTAAAAAVRIIEAISHGLPSTCMAPAVASPKNGTAIPA